jgi:hypothetical protein
MDDDKDKNVIEQLVDKINDAVEKIATTASEALQHAMEPEPEKPGEQPVALMPMAGDGLVADMALPPVVVAPRRKKSTSKKAPKTSPKKVAKKAAKKSAKKTVKKSSAKKKAAKARKPAVGRNDDLCPWAIRLDRRTVGPRTRLLPYTSGAEFGTAETYPRRLMHAPRQPATLSKSSWSRKLSDRPFASSCVFST